MQKIAQPVTEKYRNLYCSKNYPKITFKSTSLCRPCSRASRLRSDTGVDRPLGGRILLPRARRRGKLPRPHDQLQLADQAAGRGGEDENIRRRRGRNWIIILWQYKSMSEIMSRVFYGTFVCYVFSQKKILFHPLLLYGIHYQSSARILLAYTIDHLYWSALSNLSQFSCTTPTTRALTLCVCTTATPRTPAPSWRTAGCAQTITGTSTNRLYPSEYLSL